MKVLVVGGAGYIGSHAVLELIKDHHNVLVFDNLTSGFEDMVSEHATLIVGDIRDKNALDNVFKKHNDIDVVMHFAAKIVVPESVEKPLEYYSNNVEGVRVLLESMQENNIKNIVFSSTAAVYGEASGVCFEDDNTNPINPYGRTKLMGENLLNDWSNAKQGRHAVALRYFNPVGADPSGEIGEDPYDTPNNLMPFISQTAVGRRDYLQVFGNDYDTRDGTCIRDYIHVCDLASAIVKAVEEGPTNTPYECLGSNTGWSVLEVLDVMEQVTGKKLNRVVAPRREGDAVASVVDKLSDFVTLSKSIEDMCLDQYKLEIGKNE